MQSQLAYQVLFHVEKPLDFKGWKVPPEMMAKKKKSNSELRSLASKPGVDSDSEKSSQNADNLEEQEDSSLVIHQQLQPRRRNSEEVSRPRPFSDKPVAPRSSKAQEESRSSSLSLRGVNVEIKVQEISGDLNQNIREFRVRSNHSSDVTHNPMAARLRAQAQAPDKEDNLIKKKGDQTHEQRKQQKDKNAKEITEFNYPADCSLQLQRHCSKESITLNIISYEMVANWEELNADLIRDKIECSTCYNIIFHHESLSNRIGPIAYQCNLCNSALFCSSCAEKLKCQECPMCKRDESQIEPASAIISREIEKMRFRCQYSLKGQCPLTKGMTPRELFQHVAQDCPAVMSPNNYTLKSRNQGICKFYCNLKSFKTPRLVKRERGLLDGPDGSDQIVRHNCWSCRPSNNSIGSLMRRQCRQHFQQQSFPEGRVRLKNEQFRLNVQALKCFCCKEFPLVSKMCSNCQICILCLRCARRTLVVSDQCPECSIAKPQFIDLPRNLRSFHEQVEVQCEKCVDQYLLEKFAEPLVLPVPEPVAVLNKPKFEKIMPLSQDGDREAVESIRSSDIGQEASVQRPPEPPSLALPELSNTIRFQLNKAIRRAKDRIGQAKQVETKEEKAERRQLRKIKAKLTPDEEDEIREAVPWLPYHSFQEHWESCQACPNCMYTCKDCSLYIKIKDREEHEAFEAAERERRTTSSRDIRSMRPQFQRSGMQRLQRETTNFDELSSWKRYLLSVRYQNNSISRTITRLETESNFLSFNYKNFVVVLLDFLVQFSILVLGFFLIIQDSLDLPLEVNDEVVRRESNWERDIYKHTFITLTSVFYVLITAVPLVFQTIVSTKINRRTPLDFSGTEIIFQILYPLTFLIQGQIIFKILSGGVLNFNNLRRMVNTNYEFTRMNRYVPGYIAYRWAIQFLFLVPLLLVLRFNARDKEVDGMGANSLEKWFLWLLFVSCLVQQPITVLVLS